MDFGVTPQVACQDYGIEHDETSFLCWLLMVIGIEGDSVKRRICSFDGDTAYVETDRLQIVIYVAGGSLKEMQ